MTGVAAGWFEDPEDPLQVRWWDGAEWTDHRTDAPPATPPVELPTPSFVPQSTPQVIDVTAVAAPVAPVAPVAPASTLPTWGSPAQVVQQPAVQQPATASFVPPAATPQPGFATWGSTPTPAAATPQPTTAPAPVVRDQLVHRSTGQRVVSVAFRTIAAIAIVVANGVAAVVVVNDGLAEVEVAADEAPIAEEAPELYDSFANVPSGEGTPTWTPTPLVEPLEGELYETSGGYAVVLLGPTWQPVDRDSGHRGWEIRDESGAVIGVAEIEVRQSTQPADLIGLANALAAEPDEYLGGGTTSNHSLLGDPAAPTAMARFDFVGADPTQLARVWMTVGSGPTGTTESIIRLYAADSSFAAAAWAVEAYCESMAAQPPK